MAYPTEVGFGFPLAEEAGVSPGGDPGYDPGPNFNFGSGDFDLGKFFAKGNPGNTGVGGLMMLLNANQQRRDANRPILSPLDEQNIVQEGTNSLSRSLSTQGNPAGSGRAQQELQNYATKTLSRLRYEDAIRKRSSLAQADNNMYGAGAFGLQALLQALTQGQKASTTTAPIGSAVY